MRSREVSERRNVRNGEGEERVERDEDEPNRRASNEMLKTDGLVSTAFDTDFVDVASWDERWPRRLGHAPGL